MKNKKKKNTSENVIFIIEMYTHTHKCATSNMHIMSIGDQDELYFVFIWCSLIFLNLQRFYFYYLVWSLRLRVLLLALICSYVFTFMTYDNTIVAYIFLELKIWLFNGVCAPEHLLLMSLLFCVHFGFDILAP